MPKTTQQGQGEKYAVSDNAIQRVALEYMHAQNGYPGMSSDGNWARANREANTAEWRRAKYIARRLLIAYEGGKESDENIRLVGLVMSEADACTPHMVSPCDELKKRWDEYATHLSTIEEWQRKYNELGEEASKTADTLEHAANHWMEEHNKACATIEAQKRTIETMREALEAVRPVALAAVIAAKKTRVDYLVQWANDDLDKIDAALALAQTEGK